MLDPPSHYKMPPKKRAKARAPIVLPDMPTSERELVSALRDAGSECCRIINTLWKDCGLAYFHATPWMHTMYCHAWQYVEIWGSLQPFGLWGLEASHKKFKSMWQFSIKKTRRKQGTGRGGDGASDILMRINVQLAKLRHPTKRRIGPRISKHIRSIALVKLKSKYKLLR